MEVYFVYWENVHGSKEPDKIFASEDAATAYIRKQTEQYPGYPGYPHGYIKMHVEN